MLQIINLSKNSSSHLKNISFQVHAGEVVNIECSEEISQLLFRLIIANEIPSSGSILIENIENITYVKNSMHSIGLVTNHDSFYERLTINEYLSFYNELLGNGQSHRSIMMKLGLLDIGHLKISELSFSQRKRLSLARERLKDLKLILLQDPLLNLEKDAARIVLENISELKESGVAILNATTSFKDCITLGGRTYILNEEGIEEIQPEISIDSRVPKNIEENIPAIQKVKYEENNLDNIEKPMYKVDRIPAKMDERILLFNPKEIDYIESEQSLSYLSVRGEKFVCPLTLNELEDRLKHLGFFRTHRSYLVNLQRVRELVVWTRNSYSLILEDKNRSTVPLSKGRIDELKNILRL